MACLNAPACRREASFRDPTSPCNRDNSRKCALRSALSWRSSVLRETNQLSRFPSKEPTVKENVAALPDARERPGTEATASRVSAMSHTGVSQDAVRVGVSKGGQGV